MSRSLHRCIWCKHSEISWEYSGCVTASDTDFACGMYTAEGATPHWTIEVYVYDYTIISGIPVELWRDTARWSTQQLSISASYGGTTNPAPGTYTCTSDESATVTVSPSSGWHFDFWILDDTPNYSNPITITMDSDHELTAYFGINNGGGGEPCPTLFVWDGTCYVDYGVINIHDPSGKDIIREVPVLAEDVGINNYKARFRLQEGWPGLEFSESDIDQVKLYAVDDEGKRRLCPLIEAVHDEQGNVLLQLLMSDDYKIKITLLEIIDLTFVVPYPNIQSFTFIIEGNNMLKP